MSINHGSNLIVGLQELIPETGLPIHPGAKEAWHSDNRQKIAYAKWALIGITSYISIGSAIINHQFAIVLVLFLILISTIVLDYTSGGDFGNILAVIGHSLYGLLTGKWLSSSMIISGSLIMSISSRSVCFDSFGRMLYSMGYVLR